MVKYTNKDIENKKLTNSIIDLNKQKDKLNSTIEALNAEIESRDSQINELQKLLEESQKKNTINKRIISSSTQISRGGYDQPRFNISISERELLARIVFLEAGNQSNEGQQAVVETILNRVKSTHPSFPNTISEVIYKYGQFSTAKYVGRAKPSDKEYANVDKVLSGEVTVLPNDNYVYFATSKINGRNYIKIGDHYFSQY